MARINPKLIQAIRPLTAQRFWTRMDRVEGSTCWLWRGCKDKDGYGIFASGEHGNYRAGRIAYFLHYGIDPEHQCVCHTCDNPTCCNPAHLFLASHYENMQDKIRKGRDARGDRQGRRLHPERWPIGFKKDPDTIARGSSHGCAKLTEHDAVEIRRLYAQGGITQTQIGTQFGVTKHTVSLITKRKIWKHV